MWETRLGRLSYQVLEEFYATVTRKLDPGMEPGEARADVRNLLPWEPVVVDASVLEIAWRLESRWPISFWDSSILAAARIAGCPHLLTEDLGDGETMGGVTVVNPFTHEPGSILG